MSKLISIVLASYNAGHFLESTINSIQNQTYTDWELIVVNDGSSDNTIEVIERLRQKDSRIRLYSLEKNSGNPSLPRNVGVSKANGSWIAIFDADDFWHPRKLEFQMKFLSETGAQFCSTEMKTFRDEKEVRFKKIDTVEYEVITFADHLKRFNTPTPSVILKKHLLVKFPFLDDMIHDKREDLKCWLEIHQEIGESIKLKFPFLHYRRSPGQISRHKSKLVLKTFLVLWNFRLSNGKKLGIRSVYYTFTHLLHATICRLCNKSL